MPKGFEYVDISVPAVHELDPDDDIDYDDVELPSDPWTVCTAQCYSQRVMNGIGLYGVAVATLFMMQLRGTRIAEPLNVHRVFFLWPMAVASACDYLLSNQCMQECANYKRSQKKHI